MTYKLQNDVNMALSTEQPLLNSTYASQPAGDNGFKDGGPLAGARPKDPAAVNLSKGQRPNPSPPTYGDALQGGCMVQPPDNCHYPNRNEILWLQRKRLNEDDVEFSV